MSGFGAAGAPPAPTIAGWQHLRTGKVRDLYTNGSDEILLVASDRISAFDWVLPTMIPNKGAILTQLSLFWFELLEDIVPNHIISDDVPAEVIDRAALDALISQPIEFTGDARQQIARVVDRIDAITSAHPAAAQYKPHSIR